MQNMRKNLNIIAFKDRAVSAALKLVPAIVERMVELVV